MSLRIAVLQHEPETGLGSFGRLLEDAGVHYEVVETTSATALLPEPVWFDGAIALGGSLDASDPRLLEARRWIRDAVLRDTPFLGICLGAQLLASALGARVYRGLRPEIGIHDIFLTGASDNDALFGGLPRRLSVFGWHEDTFVLPRGALPLAGSIAYRHQAFRYGASAYGIQFHPEIRVEDLRRWKDVPGYAAHARGSGRRLGCGRRDAPGCHSRPAGAGDRAARALASGRRGRGCQPHDASADLGFVVSQSTVLIRLETRQLTRHANRRRPRAGNARGRLVAARPVVHVGFTLPLAARLARDARYDLHALIGLVERGCSPELAVRIWRRSKT